MRKKGNVGIRVLVNILGLCVIAGGFSLMLQGIPKEYWKNVLFIILGYIGIGVGTGILKEANGGK